MGLPRIERKLAAILAADVAGYSRLMGVDEEGTVARLRAHRRALVDPKIKEHRGRIVKTTGDGMLVEFASVVDAVRCAVEVQRGMAERNAGVPQDKRIEFRVGINLGDIIVEDKDIFGDGVNVAARLEALAEPGGICVSQAACDQVRDKLGFSFEDIGEQAVKNIARPIRTYRVRFEGVEFAGAAPKTEAPQRKRLAAWVAACVVLFVGVAGAAWFVTRPAVAPGAPRLSIVVLPFVNLSGDPRRRYFADGITENLTSDLSQIPGSFVIARGSAFTYKGKPVDARQVGHELGVRYIIEGSVQRFGTAIRVNAQLIDATRGAQLWADRFEGDLSNLSVLDDAVTARVTRTLSVELTEAEAHRSLRKRPNNPDAVDYLLQTQAIFNRGLLPKAAQDEMRRLAEAALQLDPKNYDALMWLATADVGQVMNYYSDNRTDQLRQAEEEIDRALGAAPSSFYAHYTKGKVFMTQKKHVEAVTEFETALRLNSNHVPAYARIGEVKLYVGHPEEALEYLAEARRRSPKDPLIPVWHLLAGYAYLMLRQTDAAIDEYRRAAAEAPYHGPLQLHLACAYGLAGRESEAHAAFAAANRLLPNFTTGTWKENSRSDDASYVAYRKRCSDVFQQLGMPEE